MVRYAVQHGGSREQEVEQPAKKRNNGIHERAEKRGSAANSGSLRSTAGAKRWLRRRRKSKNSMEKMANGTGMKRQF